MRVPHVASRVTILMAMGLSVCGIEVATTYFFGDQTLAPLLSVLCCAALVFFGSPRLILAAIPLFAALTYVLIMDSSRYPLIRTTTMVLGGLLAYWTCRQNLKLEEQISETDLILSKMHSTWILCDRAGNIQRMSTPAAQLVRANFKDLEGTSFFFKFSGGPARGELIQKFLKAADSRVAVDRVGLNLVGQPGSYTDASFIPIQTKEGTCILVLFPSNSSS